MSSVPGNGKTYIHVDDLNEKLDFKNIKHTLSPECRVNRGKTAKGLPQMGFKFSRGMNVTLLLIICETQKKCFFRNPWRTPCLRVTLMRHAMFVLTHMNYFTTD